MRKVVLIFGVIIVLGAMAANAQTSAQSANDPALKPIINNFSARNYAAGAVTKTELDLIIQAGIRAPSAGNRQQWHFTIVQDQALARQLIPQTTEGNVLVVISGLGDSKTNGAVILDCGLAAQSMFLAAQALGLGARQYTGTIDNVNNNFKSALGLPQGHSAVIIIRIGRLPAGVDAASSASPRQSVEQKVTYK